MELERNIAHSLSRGWGEFFFKSYLRNESRTQILEDICCPYPLGCWITEDMSEKCLGSVPTRLCTHSNCGFQSKIWMRSNQPEFKHKQVKFSSETTPYWVDSCWVMKNHSFWRIQTVKTSPCSSAQLHNKHVWATVDGLSWEEKEKYEEEDDDERRRIGGRRKRKKL